jgi:hypothetical protein
VHSAGSVHLGANGHGPGSRTLHDPSTQSADGQIVLPSLQTRQGTSGGGQSAGSLQPPPAPHSSGAQPQLVGSAQVVNLLPEMPE